MAEGSMSPQSLYHRPLIIGPGDGLGLPQASVDAAGLARRLTRRVLLVFCRPCRAIVAEDVAVGR
jgi:hypothetical protein